MAIGWSSELASACGAEEPERVYDAPEELQSDHPCVNLSNGKMKAPAVYPDAGLRGALHAALYMPVKFSVMALLTTSPENL